jgi:hypothetical protein
MNGMHADDAPAASSRETATAVASAGSGAAAALLTLVSAACCVGPVIAPLIVGLLGASGAVWAAGLKPYSAWILAASFLCLVFGFWTVYRPRPACAITDAPDRRQVVLQRVARISLWFGAVSWTTALLLRLILP